MTNGNDKAYPEIETHIDYDCDAAQRFDRVFSESGLTKREYFAGLAMQGIISGITQMDDIGIITNRPNDVAGIAVTYANCLIEALNETED